MIKLLFLSSKKKGLLQIVFPLIISSIVVLSLLRDGLPPTHDGEYHIVRAYQFDKTLRDGDFYPRWLPDLNYGYGTPLLNYYYPLPYYMMSIIHFFGISFIDAFKLSLFIATLLGTVFFFLWARFFWGNGGGFIASLFYTFSPYHIVELYVRGAVGEVWALAFFPAFLWSITKAIKEQRVIFFSISAIFFASIIFSHNILALLFSPFLLTYMMILFYRYKNIASSTALVRMSSVVFLGLGLASVFWLPALFERGYVEGLQIYNIKENFPELYQLLLPSWGTGFSGSDLNGQMSFQIGLVNLGAVFLSLLSMFTFYKKKDKRFSMTGFFIFWFVLIFFLLQKASLPIWENLPFMNYFQFPWRFLALEILIASFLGGSIVSLFKGKKGKAIIMIACVFSVSLSIGYVSPAYYLVRDDSYYFTRPNFMDGTNTPGNFFNTVWFSKNIKERKQENFEIVSGKGKITKTQVKATQYKFTLSAESDVQIRVNTAYFPNWQAFIDGRKTETKMDKGGLIEFLVPKGNHEVLVKLLNTPVRTVSEIISSLSFFALLFSLIRIR